MAFYPHTHTHTHKAFGLVFFVCSNAFSYRQKLGFTTMPAFAQWQERTASKASASSSSSPLSLSQLVDSHCHNIVTLAMQHAHAAPLLCPSTRLLPILHPSITWVDCLCASLERPRLQFPTNVCSPLLYTRKHFLITQNVSAAQFALLAGLACYWSDMGLKVSFKFMYI